MERLNMTQPHLVEICHSWISLSPSCKHQRRRVPHAAADNYRPEQHYTMSSQEASTDRTGGDPDYSSWAQLADATKLQSGIAETSANTGCMPRRSWSWLNGKTVGTVRKFKYSNPADSLAWSVPSNVCRGMISATTYTAKCTTSAFKFGNLLVSGKGMQGQSWDDQTRKHLTRN